MKRISRLAVLSLLLCLLSAMILSGCKEGKSGNTIEEPKITGKYLTKEYSKQLLTDGAETMLGSVSIEKSGESYTVTITEKEVVANSTYENGYYIADTNVTKSVAWGSDARIACLHDNKYKVETAEQFIKKHNGDTKTLYTVYIMGDSAELLVSTQPEDVLNE